MRIFNTILALVALTWLCGYIFFIQELPSYAVQDRTPTDAVVVLTGGANRIENGASLLAQGRAKHLFISGVNTGVGKYNIPSLGRLSPELIDCCVSLGHDAKDTNGNVEEVKSWMDEEGYTSMRLVTSISHMPRSLLIFQRKMSGIKIIPHAVGVEKLHQENLSPWKIHMSSVREYNKFIFAYLWPW